MAGSEKKDRTEAVLRNAQIIVRPFRELWHGIWTNSVPWTACGVTGTLAILLFLRRWDLYFLRRFGMSFLYPKAGIIRTLYIGGAAFSGFLGWALYRAGQFNQLAGKLELAMINSGLKNRLGKTPRLIGDWPVDENTRKLRVTSADFPKRDFDSARPALETALRVYIDEIRENRAAGSFDFIYSTMAMPTSMEWPGAEGLGQLRFPIGRTRSNRIVGTLRETPHLLIAGQTGGGGTDLNSV